MPVFRKYAWRFNACSPNTLAKYPCYPMLPLLPLPPVIITPARGFQRLPDFIGRSAKCLLPLGPRRPEYCHVDGY